MKVRKIIHGPRDRIQHRWPSEHLRRAHRAVRKFAAQPENEKYADRITLSLLITAGLQERRYQRFLKTMRRPSYHKRVYRLLAEAKRTNGRIVHDSRGSRVVPREPA